MGKITPESIRQISKGCLTDNANLNDILSLLKYCKSPSPDIAHAAITSLQFVFSKLIASGMLEKRQSDGKSSTELATWLRENRAQYFEVLRETMSHTEPRLQLVSFEKHIQLLKNIAEHHNEFQSNLFLPLVEVLLCQESISGPLLAKVVHTLNKHDDLRFFFFRSASKVLTDQYSGEKTESTPLINIQNAYTIISKLSPAPDSFDSMKLLCEYNLAEGKDENPNPFTQPTIYCRAFSNCWLAFMRHSLPREIYKSCLESLHQKIIPYLSKPVLLMDFLVDAYNTDGIIRLLALNGIFTLITEHNLDYPDFYAKLYALFDSNLLHYKYRARFFRLADIFLSSSYLPSYLVAAFVKRMGRLCLTAPPAGIIMILPFIFNLMKRHPSSIQLIHTRQENLEQMSDPFDFTEMDPSKCNAQESYLWEIQALQMHAVPTVSGLARVFQDSLAKPLYDLEDFMDYTYKSMVDSEVNLKKRKFLEEEPPAVSIKVNQEWLNGTLWVEA
ncbi:Maturation and nuclear export of 40S ribosomal subunits interacting protein [Batrachochytrium dendrobatidis]|nr:Maturation and nuclear export of 40S ribosomal subunits interacting protein [Batrachochytrium dendrobatidis]